MNIKEKIQETEKPWRDEEILRELYGTMTQGEVAELLGCQQSTVSRWMDIHDISTGYNEGDLPYEKAALFSGGHDSLVSTHVVMEKHDGDVVVHIDTGTGIEENLDFVKDVCESFGWPLEIIRPNTTLEEFAKKWGFPKAAAHSWIYRYLKDHPLHKFARDCENKPNFYTGVRKAESDRRMKTVSEETEDVGQWVWHSPIAEWSDQDIEDYIEIHNLPRNPVVDHIGRSGECFCGAYSDRISELETLHDAYPEHYDWIMETEERVQSEIGSDDPQCYWGNIGVSDEDDFSPPEKEDMTLCEDCGAHRSIS